ncbi:MauE/DoxX family redox-associated membrane protein [Aurantibacillus circumpalustris]|uniref:MauE/DoxX family redox-associated membrane protein n=1 Tax=Aurantibacillus circumpalustris TaxID=3036359 RepID=UPI00295B3065|nr:MauE/DoxX family redox-associated membrane protein [Aurantibacillus circumpalustris]
MKILKLIVSILLSVALGLVFIYSGYSKLFPIETFEFTFVDIGIANWYTAPVIARILISLEFFIGVLLIANYNLRKFTLPFTIGLLLFFILYLSVQIAIGGNNGNCGCFGESIRMTPLQGILKNIAMITIGVLLYILSNGWKLKYNALFTNLLAITITCVPFIFNPIDYAYTSNNLDEKVGYPLELNLLFEPSDTSKVEIPSIELRKNKHVLSFLSLTCQHCRVAAKKIRLIKRNNPDLPFYFILNGDKSNYKEFIEDTKATNIPSSFCLGKSFVQLSSAHLPRIYFIDNGMVIKKVDYYELNQYIIENWIKTGNPN